MPRPRPPARPSLADTPGIVPLPTSQSMEVQLIPLEALVASQRNPRRKLEGIDELAASLDAHGLLQPVVARVVGNRYELVAGHRRVAAARQLGWEAIPALVRSDTDDQAYLLTLVENLQRQDLRPREEAAALEVLVRERRWSTHQVAAAIQRSQSFVSKRLRVFEDPQLGPAVLAEQLPVSAAEELLTVPTTRRYALLEAAVAGQWDIARVRQAARGGRFASNQARSGLPRRVHTLRMELRDLRPEQLTEASRRELRLLFSELALLARAAPAPGRRPVLPPLPGSTPSN